ncbi:MAG TPA: HAD family hydrolase [Gammaproteobacteria bacterium]|nr:HAD family hydrolase [Gammaproteobacteria bacterium]
MLSARKFDLLVFDWDGTLVDSIARIVACLRAAAHDAALPALAEDKLRDVIGLGLREAIDTLYPAEDTTKLQIFVDAYRHHYLHGPHGEARPFAGALELLADLRRRGYLLAVATGKSRRGLDRALRELACGHLFDATRCADESFSKPQPHMLMEIMDDLGVDAKRCLLVGDTEHDRLMAQNAGTAFVGVCHGVHGRGRLAGPDTLCCVDSIQELAHWFDEQHRQQCGAIS